MAKFKMSVLVPTGQVDTARVGDTSSTVALTQNNVGKFFKLVADSQYAMCDVGDPIEGVLIAVEPATRDGYIIGSVQKSGRVEAICDGLQATPGTGTIAVGDVVVCGTVVADGTALTTAPKVTKATNQPGATVTTVDNTKAEIDIALAKVVGQANLAAKGAWRVVSLGSTGAVGDTCIIEKV